MSMANFCRSPNTPNDGNLSLDTHTMETINPNLELKFNSREIFSIVLSLQTILQLHPKNHEILNLIKVIHTQLTPCGNQVLSLDVFDTANLLVELFIFNEGRLHSSYLKNICLKIHDAIVEYITVEFIDEIDLQMLLKESGIV